MSYAPKFFKAEETRPNAYQRGYATKRWQKLRLMVLRRYPVCTLCNHNAATIAHHILDKSLGGADSLENLTGVCQACHNRHHKSND